MHSPARPSMMDSRAVPSSLRTTKDFQREKAAKYQLLMFTFWLPAIVVRRTRTLLDIFPRTWVHYSHLLIRL